MRVERRETAVARHMASNYTIARHALFDKFAADFDSYLRGELPSDVVDATTGY